MSPIPHSITRTFSRFWTELTSKSGSLSIHELEVAKYKALASLRYLASLVVLPWIIPILLRKGLEPWITNWWNTGQSHQIYDYLQEESALESFEKIEELFLLERMLEDSSGTHSQDLRELHKETIQLVEMYNEDCIQIISNVLTNLIGFVLILSLIHISEPTRRS